MQSLVESPWPVLFAGVLIEAGLAVAILRTGRGKLVWLMLLVGVLTLAGLGIERMVVTDREAITDTLHTACDAVEDNDIERLLGCISPSADGPRQMSRRVLDRFDVDNAWYGSRSTSLPARRRPTSISKRSAKGKTEKGKSPTTPIRKKS